MFKIGLRAMMHELESHTVLVHGYMPDEIFDEFLNDAEFRRYANQFERTHRKVGA